MEQVKELGAWLWASKTYFREHLGNEVASLKAETETLCTDTGIRLMYRTLVPDSWDLILA